MAQIKLKILWKRWLLLLTERLGLSLPAYVSVWIISSTLVKNKSVKYSSLSLELIAFIMYLKPQAQTGQCEILTCWEHCQQRSDRRSDMFPQRWLRKSSLRFTVDTVASCNNESQLVEGSIQWTYWPYTQSKDCECGCI